MLMFLEKEGDLSIDIKVEDHQRRECVKKRRVPSMESEIVLKDF